MEIQDILKELDAAIAQLHASAYPYDELKEMAEAEGRTDLLELFEECTGPYDDACIRLRALRDRLAAE